MKMEKAQALQNRLYFILEKLQSMAKEVPSKYQQRLPNDLLSGLANTLLHDTIFEIVKGLKEIQDVTEKQLFQSRLQIMDKHRSDRQLLADTHNDTSSSSFIADKDKLIGKQKTELRQFDVKVINQMDQKVSEQQVILEKAGVPGFYVTNNPQEIRIQMFLLDFILRLDKMDIPEAPLDD